MSKDSSMAGKTCLITGANSGIGLATANALANKGADIIMVCRNEAKGLGAIDTIERQTGHRGELILGDLSSISDTQRVAEDVKDRWDKLDVLVNNAGGYFPDRLESVDGLEMNFALNHMPS